MNERPKKGAFGYNSKEIEAYLIEISAKYESDVKAKDAKIEDLSAKVTELTEKIAVYEVERLSVADALVKAQKEAQDILDAAVVDGNNEKARIEAECDALRTKVEEAKTTLANMKADALKVIDEYKECVEKFTAFNDGDGV